MEGDVVEKIMALSEEDRQNMLFSELRYERELNKCVGLMYGSEELSSVLEQVLMVSCGFLEARRGLFFVLRDGAVYCSEEWCAPGAGCGEGGLKRIDPDILGPILPRLAGADVIAVRSVEDIKEECPKLLSLIHI